VLVVPNVSGAEPGTKFSKIYNFTDYTNNKAYEGTTSDTTTEVTIPDDYYALNSSDDVYQIYQTPAKTVGFAYTRFEFKINESAGSINEINITWVGLGDSQGGFGNGYNLYVYNVTSGSWTQEKSYSTDATKQTEYIVYTSGFSDFINSSGYLKVLARSNSSALSNKWVDIGTDYIDVNVTYCKIWNVSTDKETYSIGETISVTWDNEEGFGGTETCINIDYRNNTDNVGWCLHSRSNTSTSDTSDSIPSGCGGHYIDIYVYTASGDFDNYTAAITKGDPWPKTTSSHILPEFLIIAIPLLSAVAIYFLMRRRSNKKE
jgi:hypothetical protein